MDIKKSLLLNKIPKIKLKRLTIYLLIFVFAPIFTYITGKKLDNLFSLPSFPSYPYNLIFGMMVFLGGLAIGIKSTRLLYQIGKGLPWGEISHDDRSKRLVTTGLYAYSRNPMTFGYSMLPCGMGMMFQSLGMAVFITTLVFIINILWLKMIEEPKLEKRFGETYSKYRRKTPFLIPRVNPLKILSLLRNDKTESS